MIPLLIEKNDLERQGKNVKKESYKEIIGILSLSLLLTSAFSISGCLPEMLKEFEGYSRSNMEFLISAPTVSVVFMIALSPVISRMVNDRIIVISGLMLTGIAGSLPCFLTSYSAILAARILLGIGTGLINARAVSLIGERFCGEQRAKLLGVRSSMETLGQATLTFLAGQLLVFGWNYAFLIYASAFVILILYLICVPSEGKDKKERKSGESGQDSRMKGKDWTRIAKYLFLGSLMISANSVVSLRIPTLLVETEIGTASDGATILSISVLAGFLGGFAFGGIVEKLKQYALPFSLFMTAAGMLVISLAGSLPSIALGTVITGFFITICVSYVFNGVSESVSKEALNTANAAVLVGCNLGSAVTPFFLQVISKVNDSLAAGFFVYMILLLLTALYFGIRKGAE